MCGWTSPSTGRVWGAGNGKFNVGSKNACEFRCVHSQHPVIATYCTASDAPCLCLFVRLQERRFSSSWPHATRRGRVCPQRRLTGTLTDLSHERMPAYPAKSWPAPFASGSAGRCQSCRRMLAPVVLADFLGTRLFLGQSILQHPAPPRQLEANHLPGQFLCWCPHCLRYTFRVDENSRPSQVLLTGKEGEGDRCALES